MAFCALDFYDLPVTYLCTAGCHIPHIGPFDIEIKILFYVFVFFLSVETRLVEFMHQGSFSSEMGV